MKWGAKRRRSRPIYKTVHKRSYPRAGTVAQLVRSLAYMRNEAQFGRNPGFRRYVRRTGYKVNTYKRSRKRYKRLEANWM